jgi:hypothetical protein
MWTAECSKSKSFTREAVTVIATHVRNGVGLADSCAETIPAMGYNHAASSLSYRQQRHPFLRETLMAS